MSGRTGERPLGEIVTDINFWKLHIVNFPAIFLSGWLFVSTGLAYDAFGTPRPNQYFSPAQPQVQVLKERYSSKQQIENFLSSFKPKRSIENDQ